MGNPLARVGDTTACPVLLPLPHLGGPIVGAMPVGIEANGKVAARLGDFANCKLIAPQDVIFEGAATVTACNLPLARVGDHTVHTGSVVVGSGNVQVGGPTFSPPPNIAINGTARYRSKVIRDLYFLSTTRTGRHVLDQLRAAKRPVTIEDGPPFGASAQAVRLADAMNGVGTGTNIKYNPEVSIQVRGADGLIPFPPQVLLGHELIHALHHAQGISAGIRLDTYPAIHLRESQAIGVGKYNGTFPTENSLRRELNLTRRINWDGRNGVLGVPALDLRPGKCA